MNVIGREGTPSLINLDILLRVPVFPFEEKVGLK